MHENGRLALGENFVGAKNRKKSGF